MFIYLLYSLDWAKVEFLYTVILHSCTFHDCYIVPRFSSSINNLDCIGRFVGCLDAATDCNNTFSATQGIVTSPGFPSTYPLNSDCYNYISAPTGSSVTLTFTTFGLEYQSECHYDWLKVISIYVSFVMQIIFYNFWIWCKKYKKYKKVFKKMTKDIWLMCLKL